MIQQPPPVFDILDPDGKDTIKSLEGNSDLVLLVGSKISEWHPSNVPGGLEITRQIADLLSSLLPNADEEQRRKISRYIRRAPFEYILDRCPRKDVLRRLLSGLVRVSIPNSAHKAIENLVSNGRIHSMITPNYDLCFDSILPDGAPLKHVVQPDDAKGLSRDSRILFKIHGTAAVGLESSMVLTLSEEGRLPEWKQSLLQTCLEGRTLLVMGFSALDFEISPYLVKSKPKLVIWNCYRNPIQEPEILTPNAQRILSSCPSIVIWGDLRHILAEMDSPFIWYNPSSSVGSVVQMISHELSSNDLKSWAAAVLSSPGYALYAETIARDLMKVTEKDTDAFATAVFLLGDSLYSRGRYREASERNAEASSLFLMHGNIPGYIFSEAKGVDSLRCWGRFQKAHQRLTKARETLSQTQHGDMERLNTKLDLQEVLILREQFLRAEILYNLGIRRMASRMKANQEKAEQLLRGVLNISEKNGQWHDIQQCRMWAGRLKIPFSEVYNGPLEPLDDLAGWHHLGHMVPEMMSLRGYLRKRNYDKAPEKVVREHTSIAKEIGCDPEVWKLTLALWKHYGWRLRDSQIDWLLAFIHCQYTFVMRVFKLLVEEYR